MILATSSRGIRFARSVEQTTRKMSGLGWKKFPLFQAVDGFLNTNNQHSKAYFFDHAQWDSVTALNESSAFAFAQEDIHAAWMTAFEGRGRVLYRDEQSDYKVYGGRGLVSIKATLWYVDQTIDEMGNDWPRIRRSMCPTSHGSFDLGWVWVEEDWRLYRFKYAITPYQGLRDLYSHPESEPNTKGESGAGLIHEVTCHSSFGYTQRPD